ncbi:MAG TPA: MFS transporter [Methylomirabilota bacterium]|nr:MFS transporter [Methylomirabilota bacterium]
MKKWSIVILLACAQFVMILDSTVMNVSISTVVKDLDTTVAAMQTSITFYALTMAALMLLGAKLGEVFGRKKIFITGAIIYATGSLVTGLSQNIQTLFLGWSVIEGIGAVMVIPAISALVANNYTGKDRVKAFAIIGGISGAAMAAGPLIGGFMTTYLSWRYVFFAEVVIMGLILLFRGVLKDSAKVIKAHIDVTSVILSAVGLISLVYGMLQSKTWGWINPMGAMTINGKEITPLGISMVAYLILLGIIVLKLFYDRQQKLKDSGQNPLIDPDLFSIKQLRSGLSVLLSQYTIIAGVFFVIPVYLQMTLGYDALKTGIKIFPLSIGLILFSVIGTRLAAKWPPKKIIRVGQYILILSSVVLLGSVSASLKGWLFGVSMFTVGAALGLLASQLGNINMSAVQEKDTSAVGGLQGVFQNLGSSLGTALIGSVLIASLTTTFNQNVQGSDLPANVKSSIATGTKAGVEVIPVTQVNEIAESKGLSTAQSNQLAQLYSDSQVSSLRTAIYGLIFIAVASLLFSKNIPDKFEE